MPRCGEDEADDVVSSIRARHGALSVIVVTAGTIEPTPSDPLTPNAFDRIVGVNLRGPFFLVQKALDLLRPGGAVVLTSSYTAVRGIAGVAMYSASKAAVKSLVRTWATELRDRGVRVNCVRPGAAETGVFAAQFGPDMADAVKTAEAAQSPEGRLAKPEEVAAAAVFLASDQASFVNGSELVVDGGLTEL